MSVPLPATVDPAALPAPAPPGLELHGGHRPAAPNPVLAVLSALAALWRRLPPKAKFGAALVGFFALLAVIGPSLAPFNPSYQNQNFNVSLIPPNHTYLLGTTTFGEDVLSQLLTGVRT